MFNPVAHHYGGSDWSIVNYMILAAGRGSRMGNLSSYLQKCMYPIMGKPFLEWTLASLVANQCFNAEMDRLILVVGHMQEQIKAYFGSLWYGIPITYVEQDDAIGTAHATLLGWQACSQTEGAIIVQADVWAEPEFYEDMVNHPLPDVLSVHRHVCARRHDERVDLSKDTVAKAWKGTSPYVECGIWKFSPTLIRWMMKRKDDEFRALASVQAAIEAGLPIGFLERKRWIHLGGTEPTTHDNLKQVTRFLMDRATP